MSEPHCCQAAAQREVAIAEGGDGVEDRRDASADQPRQEPGGRTSRIGGGPEPASGRSGAVEGPVDLPRPEDWTPPSWEEVVRAHSGRVYRLAYRLTGNQHDAEDLTQEVFVRVFRSLSNYTPGTFEGWLHRITTNLFLDSVRRKQRIRFEGFADDAPERLPGREPSPEAWYDDRTFDADVQAALDSLHPDFRAAVVLCDIEGLSYEEIAATLGVKLGTVRSRIHRGRSHLKGALEHRAATRRGSNQTSTTTSPEGGATRSPRGGRDADAPEISDVASRRSEGEDAV